MSDRAHVVTAFLRNEGEILLLRRSDDVGTYTGRWGGVSGFAEGTPDEQVRVEIDEETGLAGAVELVRSGRPVEFRDEDLGREWAVHPYLFDCESRGVELSEEHVACEWVPATDIFRRDCVPELWTAYGRVAPSVRSIAADGDHGSAYLSVRALEVLRDRAGPIVAKRDDGDGSDSAGSEGSVEHDGGDEAGATGDAERDGGGRDGDAAGAGAGADEELDELRGLARRLTEARPSMAALRNRVDRAIAGADDAADVEAAAIEGIDRAVAADREAAAAVADRIDGPVLTLSRSGTVLTALREAAPDRVYVAESRPAREGIDVAEDVADELAVTVVTDAAVAHVLATEPIDAVVVGADTVLPDGRVVNKTGTRAAALAAAREGIPTYAVAASDKVTTDEAPSLESGPSTAVYDGEADLDALNPTFDVTPADSIEVVTERGPLDADGIADVAARHREHAAWREH